MIGLTDNIVSILVLRRGKKNKSRWLDPRENSRFRKLNEKETQKVQRSMKHSSIDVVIVIDCSVCTTYRVVSKIQRAISYLIKWSLGKRQCIRKDFQIAFIRCSVWPRKGTTIHKTAFINAEDAVEKELKKIKSQSLKKRPNQIPIDCEAMSKVLMEVQQMPYREDAARACIYIGE